MDRRRFLETGAAAILAAGAGVAASAPAAAGKTEADSAAKAPLPRLEPPAKGKIPVAVAISGGVTVIDFSGPWEVFQDVWLQDRGGDMDEQMPFGPYTVSETTEPLQGSAGLRLVPDYTFANAPTPRVIVVPAQRGSAALHEWLRTASRKADVTMSVCTGAFQLAKAGLLKGLDATTHHDFIDKLTREYPDVRVRKGLRFVENARISTAGGLTSGIDLALRVVERYYGRPVAERTAGYMEYQSRGWIV